MPDKVIIADDLEFIKNNINAILDIIEKDKAVLLPLSDPAFFYLSSLGLGCLNYHDFEEKDMYQDVYSTAREWGLRWYCPKDKDITEIGNFSIGSVIEWSTVYFFSYFLKLHILLPQLIKKINPAEIILVTCEDISTFRSGDRERIDILWKHIDLLPAMLSRYIAGAGYRIKLRVVNLPYASVKNNQKELFNMVIRAGFFYLNRIASLLYRMPHFFRKYNKKILFFEGFQHFFDIMKSESLKNCEIIHLHKTIGPSLLFRLYRHGIRVESLKGKRRRNTGNKELFGLDYVKGALSGFFVYRGENILPYIWPRIEFLFKKLFPEVIYPDLISAKEIIRKISPKCLVIENDSAYHERSLVAIAKELKIKSFVVQHGATWIGSSHHKDKELFIDGFYPIHCDTFFAFSEVAREWLLDLGASPGQVIVTGGVRFDSYYRNREISGNNPGPRKTVLILLNDSWCIEFISKYKIELSTFYHHLLRFIELARRNPEIDFIVRPHTEYYLWDQIFKKELASLSNFTISRQRALQEVFSNIDLVIGYISTALFEALISGIPVISLNINGTIDHFSLWGIGLSREVTNFQELDQQLQELLFDREKRGAFIEQIKKNVHLINYNHDGGATVRIAEEINRALSN